MSHGTVQINFRRQNTYLETYYTFASAKQKKQTLIFEQELSWHATYSFW
jgi:hypothetical protein